MPGAPALPRRERERLRHRGEILAAARRVLRARGLAGMTIEEVAREAEFAVGSIYRHFRSKDELLEHLLVELSRALLDELEGIPDRPLPYRQRVHAAVELVLAHLATSLPVMQAFLATAGGLGAPGTPVGEALQGVRLRFVHAMRGLVERGQAEGQVQAGPSLPITLALVGMVSAFPRWASHGVKTDEADTAGWITDAFFRAFGRS